MTIRFVRIPVDTGRKLNVNKTFNLRPVSTGIKVSNYLGDIIATK